MNLLVLMSANSIFLLVLLAVFILVSKRNGHSKKTSKKIKEDIKKIKKQISGDE